MGKKDYQLFADAVSLIKDGKNRADIITFLMKVFYNDNPRFDESRFFDWKRKIITKMGKSNIYTNKKTAEFAESNQKPMTTNQKPLEY